MLRPLTALVILLIAALPAAAAPPGLDRLVTQLRLPDVIEIMASEGEAHGADIEAEMFPGQGGARWPAVVAAIYDPTRGTRIMTDQLRESLDEGQIDALIEFFGSPLGERIITLEIDARRAIADEAVEQAAYDQLHEMQQDEAPRLDLITALIEANDLVDLNVAGGLNANLAFYTGLADGGAFGADLPQQDMLRDIWSQEPDLRADTEEWLYAYMLMAYEPLSDNDLRAYIDLAETPEGRALNHALFAGFDVLYRQVSHELGLASARMMATQDL
ncbi:DUF2059 domain-containing protein [Actibacterium sp. XHP0104]|uniref:DUF2059 domain-containing protein n=1 Tax=Actibacterium sp. XHP0104 TaxID=2984335 RepID=UPI0021E96870|nr:DUF2059 domain-containing protein [Actibacterium sp. XHP0104]MCV2881162.1 DUF2059 domain-containing protein [Actibacterium sp. XHP0104]